MDFKTNYKQIKKSNNFLELSTDKEESYFKKSVTTLHHLYDFNVNLVHNSIYLTIEMHSHNYPNDILDIYKTSYVDCVKPFNNVEQLIKFINNFLNY